MRKTVHCVPLSMPQLPRGTTKRSTLNKTNYVLTYDRHVNFLTYCGHVFAHLFNGF